MEETIINSQSKKNPKIISIGSIYHRELRFTLFIHITNILSSAHSEGNKIVLTQSQLDHHYMPDTCTLPVQLLCFLVLLSPACTTNPKTYPRFLVKWICVAYHVTCFFLLWMTTSNNIIWYIVYTEGLIITYARSLGSIIVDI